MSPTTSSTTSRSILDPEALPRAQTLHSRDAAAKEDTTGAGPSHDQYLELFDRDWYLATNLDVAAADLDPLVHYLADGAAEGRDPHPLFDTSWYLEQNPDVAAAGRNPLVHYLADGAAEGRDPHPLFDTIGYYDAYIEALGQSGLDPLSHYLSDSGQSQGTNPNRYFHRNWYLEAYPEVVHAGIDPLAHYHRIGASEGKDPSPLFQTSYYATTYPDVMDAGLSPLVHFLLAGEAEGREPRDPRRTAVQVPSAPPPYADWLGRRRLSDARASLQKRLSANFITKTVISLVVPVYKVDADVFDALIASVRAQTYPNWELCIAVAYLDDERLLSTINGAAAVEARIKVRFLPENRGISHNSNDAFELATGSFVALLDHDDALPPEALFEMAQAIEHNDGDLFYSDKDALSSDGAHHFNPLFKAAWSPETMLSANYLTHFNVIRRDFIERVGGWDPATDGAQDWDLFLRVAAAGARIRHLPKVLYHWRHVESSVAARGLAAKPYAASGQLAAIRRWLHNQGWTTAEPFFTPEGYIRIRWSESWRPTVAIVLFGKGGTEVQWRMRVDNSQLAPGTEVRHGGPTLESLSHTIAATTADIIVIAPAAMSPMTADWLAELVGPLENDEISAVCGKALDSQGRIHDAGWICNDGAWQPIFRGAEPFTYSTFGSAHWFRNYGAASLNGLAFRKSDFLRVGGLRPGQRPDIELSRALHIASGSKPQGRIVYNPFATSVVAPDQSFEQWWNIVSLTEGVNQPIPDCPAEPDPYFNINLALGQDGVPVLRSALPPVRPLSHDYEAEAAYFGNALDIDFNNSRPVVATESFGCRPTRIGWILPHFTMPFYGGLMTILRCADYLRQKNVVPVIIGLDTKKADSLRSSIALAFPALAADAEIHAIRSDEDINALGIAPLDGAVCTLWTTAFILQKMANVHQKFYFVQDYEPLFYPAGTTSSLVEATYRFGFHGICNTEPLKHLYEVFGSTADFFNPAVDTDIFHARGRVEKSDNDPVTVFSYARPGHPRNCFELLGPALAEVKRRFGQTVQIFTAGADWRPSDHGLAGAVEHLGLMPYAVTADLYRACDIGLVAMATCHPSYLPFELMATGAVVCTNFNRHTSWLLQHQKNCCLFELAKTPIADALSSLISNPGLRRELSARGLETIQQGYGNWDTSCAQVHAIMIEKFGSAGQNRPLEVPSVQQW
jgi:O-antigen biosynthesis protein